jgi:hypothetical protein
MRAIGSPLARQGLGVAHGAAIGAVILLTVIATRSLPVDRLLLGGILGIALAVAFVSPRIEISLTALVLYLGLLDGYVKLATGISSLTFGRDVILYVIAIGALMRWLVSKRPVAVPPLSGWVLLLCVVGFVQVFNPATPGANAALAGLRQQVEFVPLFVLAWAVIDSETRLRAVLLLLLLVGAINGVVSAIQFNMSPQELASWGPGYSERVLGTTKFAIRFFVDSAGDARIRPFGLGSDQGAGGAFGMIGLTAGLALWTVTRSHWRRAGIAVLLLGAVVAIIAGQSRSILIASLITGLAFVFLTTTLRTSLRALAGVGLTVVAVAIAVQFLGANQGAFTRYTGLGSKGGLLNAASERSAGISSFTFYFTHIPLGGGLASVGPAAVVTGGRPYNAESQATFSIVEVGLPGLFAFYGFLIALLVRVVMKVRALVDTRSRVLLAGACAPLFGIAFLTFGGPVTTAPPTAPFLFASAGIIARWLYPSRNPHAELT